MRTPSVIGWDVGGVNTKVARVENGELLTKRLRAELDAMKAGGLTAIEMEVEENFGQSAVYRVSL